MTGAHCDEFLEHVSIAEPTELTALMDGTAREPWGDHARDCARCQSTLALVVQGARALDHSLVEAGPWQSPDVVAAEAYQRVTTRWRRYLVRSAGGLAVAAGLIFLGNVTIPEVRRLTSAPPPVVTETFSLQCLSPAQAVSLLRPYLPKPENPRWQAERFDVTAAEQGIRAVTVSAPQPVIDRVPSILARFEQDPNAACRR